MLDLKTIRQETERIQAAVARKGGAAEADRITRILELDARRRQILAAVEIKKQERNQASKEIGKLRAAGEPVDDRFAELRRLSEAIKAQDQELHQIDADIRAEMEWVPNPPHEAVPDGADDTANVALRSHGEPPQFDFEPRAHIELGEQLGILDLEAASRLAGSGFVVLRDAGARLTRALIQWMLDLHTAEHGYSEVWSPVMVREQGLFGTGQLPKLRDDMYKIAEHDSFLIPTAEVPITGLLGGKTLPEDELPLKLAGYTACFRREAGAAGRDTRGLLRIHQFDKVELVRIAHPERSWTDHKELLLDAETILRRLGLHYRVLDLCAGDLSFAASRCYDLEVWAPGEGTWLEVSSCSNFLDFQARRLGIRMQPEQGGKSRLCHTLNASGVALPRLIVAILESYQTAAGTVRVPEPVQPYMAGMKEIVPAGAPSAPDAARA
jgi:seryl-tRNA synthetase